MLLFGSESDSDGLYRDHQDPGLRYCLPGSITLAGASDGEPDFLLLRYHGDFASAAGGLLRFTLQLSPPSAALQEQALQEGFQLREVGFEHARFRLRLRSLQKTGGDERGAWRPATLTGRQVATPAASLSPNETQGLQELLESETSAVEVDLEFIYQGLVPGLPWLAIARAASLRSHLSAWLPDIPATADQVQAAFLSLPESDGLICWQALEPGSPPGRDAFLGELALRALDRLFDRVVSGDFFEPARYHLRPAAGDEPEELSWDLTPPRLAQRRAALTWSVSDLYQSLDERARMELFPTVSQVSPFAQVDVHLINRLPFDPGYLRQASVEVRYPGPLGVLENRKFTFAGDVDVQKFSTFYPAVTTSFNLESRLTTVLAPSDGAGWPVVREGAFQNVGGLVIELDRQAAGMDFVRLEAETEIFEEAARVEVEIAGPPESAVLAQLSLTASRPVAWVALPGITEDDELQARLLAYPIAEEGQPQVLWEGGILDRRVRLPAYLLEVLEPDRITASLESEVAGYFSYVGIWLAPIEGEGHLFTLSVDAPITWNYFRPGIFAPHSYRYRVEYVALVPDGQTLPLQTTDWIVSQSTSLVIRPPVPEANP